MTGHSIWLSAPPNCTALFLSDAMGASSSSANWNAAPLCEASSSPAGVSTTISVECGNTEFTSDSFELICSANFGLKPHSARQQDIEREWRLQRAEGNGTIEGTDGGGWLSGRAIRQSGLKLDDPRRLS